MATLSYSFHIGSRGKTQKGRVSGTDNTYKTINQAQNAFKHNLRAFESEDRNKDINMTLIGSNDPKMAFNELKEAYHELFDSSVQEYNSKQTREDRKITDYLKKIEEDKKKEIMVETIIQVGNNDFWKDKTLEERQKMTEIFKNQLDLLQKKAPNYKIVNATIHYDEASPHLHIIGIPYGDNYKKGMSKQVAKNKVFNQESLEMLQNKMREPILKQMQEIYGENINLEAKSKGRNRDLLIKDYIKAKQEIDKELDYVFNENIKRINNVLVENAKKVVEGSKNDFKTEKDIKGLKNKIKGYKDEIESLDGLFSKGKALDTAKNTINILENSLINETRKNIELTNQNIILEKTIENTNKNNDFFIKNRNKEILNKIEELEKENKELKYKENIVLEALTVLFNTQKTLIKSIFNLANEEKSNRFGLVSDKANHIFKKLGIENKEKDRTR